MRAMGPVFREAGITAPQWDVLEALHTKGALTVSELMESILSTSGSLDVVVANLSEAGFVAKRACDTDRRRRIVALTDSGQAKVDDIYPQHNAALERLFAALPSESRRQTVHDLNQLRKAVSQSMEGSPTP